VQTTQSLPFLCVVEPMAHPQPLSARFLTLTT
jgi:hypothetical protein